MNRIVFLLAMALGGICSLNAQIPADSLRNYVWISGYMYDTPGAINHVIFDFRHDSLNLSYKLVPNSLYMYYTNASMCDTAGNLLIFSNGCGVMDTNFHLIPGAERINHGPLQDYFCEQLDGGGYTNTLLILPETDNKTYDLLYTRPANIPGGIGLATDRLFWAKLSHPENGIWETLWIDSTTIDTLLFLSSLSACRHANGKDWWVVAPGHDNNIYFILKLDQHGFSVHQDTIGVPSLYNEDSSGEAVFSPDGTKYARYTIFSDLRLFDFDRCTGHFSNPRHVPILDAADTIWAAGAAFSPSGRFLYAASSSYIYQLDAWADDFAASKTTVAVYDSFTYDGLPTRFYQCELAPDGRIYISCPGGKRVLHVIEHPDSAGMACNVVQHKYLLEWPISGGLPHFPNFRLGAVADSSCWQASSIPVTQQDPEGFKLWPNPATKTLHLETRDFNGKYCITDLYGRTLAEQTITSSLQTLDVAALPPGIYLLQLRPLHGKVMVRKFVISR